jgi:hypothetical protein
MSAYAAPRAHIVRDVMEFLRLHRGERFTARRLAMRLGHPEKLVREMLDEKYQDGRAGSCASTPAPSRAPPSTGSSTWCAWRSRARPIAIARWMRRHPLAVRPSILARALHVDAGVIAEQLEAWAASGSAVRCELPLREGLDRFEYRLSESAWCEQSRPWKAFREPARMSKKNKLAKQPAAQCSPRSSCKWSTPGAHARTWC